MGRPKKCRKGDPIKKKIKSSSDKSGDNNAYNSLTDMAEASTSKKPYRKPVPVRKRAAAYISMSDMAEASTSKMIYRKPVPLRKRKADKDITTDESDIAELFKNSTKIESDDDAATASESSMDDGAQDNIYKSLNSLTDKCETCGRSPEDPDLRHYEAHPQNAVEETIALASENVILPSGRITQVGGCEVSCKLRDAQSTSSFKDDRNSNGTVMDKPYTKLTEFSIYDEEGHLCYLDMNIVEKGGSIYMSGYLKPIHSHSADVCEESVPVKDIGPIVGWFTRGFDGKADKNSIIVSSEYANYILRSPNKEYKHLTDILYERIWLSKVVIEFLQKNHFLQPTYEELLQKIGCYSIPELNNKQMTEELLHKHASFLYDRLSNLRTDEDDPLIAVPCMRELIKVITTKLAKSATSNITFKTVKKKGLTKATTTPLVRKTFESFFPDQLDKTDRERISRKKRCGICQGCQLPDCGKCSACRAMAKFGGLGRSKKACVQRVCSTKAAAAEDSDVDDDAEQQRSHIKQYAADDAVPVKMSSLYRKIKWIGQPVQVDAKKTYYEKVELDDKEFRIGDYVMVETVRTDVPNLVVRIVYMWKEVFDYTEGYFHGEVFMRSADTILGELGDPSEVFVTDRCCHAAYISAILRRAYVKRKETPADWSELGGQEPEESSKIDDGKRYFYRQYYERFTCRFQDIPDDPVCPNFLRKHRYCPSCERKSKRDFKMIPIAEGLVAESTLKMPFNVYERNVVHWKGNEYKKGVAVFLRPRAFTLKNSMRLCKPKPKKRGRQKRKKIDEDIYTEYYRKRDNNVRGSHADTCRPFCVGYIVAITAIYHGELVNPMHIRLRVHVMYRPENTRNRFPHREDLNLVYWSDDVRIIPFSSVKGICKLYYVENIPEQDSIREWLERDPDRFYFKEAYHRATKRLIKVPNHATAIGKTEDAGRARPSESAVGGSFGAELGVRPLRTLDVFAGCGGLSEGLHRAGAADCRWAVENMEAAAHAYSLNNENCTVFTEDCNVFLREVMSGATHIGERRLPTRGEVELLCGGPPCQGFSGMNRFNSREYSNFTNSLVATFLSYCDYYRPDYFILENVRNFVAYKRGMVLKMTMRALHDMGYQCTFGVLQAGHYGVPQSRRRCIVLAAAPGRELPLFPEPTHAFSRRARFLNVMIDKKRFTTNMRWEKSAPRRACTIRDAMGDLPEISSGSSEEVIEYEAPPESAWERSARGPDPDAMLRDHICKKMAPLVQARISHIPTEEGSDWRDLPNISVELSDGSKCKMLEYRHDDKRNGRSSTGALRGVCACASGLPCSPEDRQSNTLIPWCLPHTGNRHGHWAGLYGRLSWDGYFSTTVTDPEPMGKQGRVLHPEQPRVVSVRECARSQGFLDSYLFAGSVRDKYRQIGNAVPPPLAVALGREIVKAIKAKEPIEEDDNV